MNLRNAAQLQKKLTSALHKRPCAAMAAGAAREPCAVAQRGKGLYRVREMHEEEMCLDCAAWVLAARAELALTEVLLAEDELKFSASTAAEALS